LINSFNVGLKVGGDNRPLIIQPGESMNLNFSTKEKCLLRDLINMEIKNCSNDFNLNSYVERLKKLKFKIQLDKQQLKKAVKLYGNDIEELNIIANEWLEKE